MNRTSLVAICLTGLLTMSVLTAGGLATERKAATQITECTTIAESGTYQLANDIEYGGDDCIVVQADDVTIDGDDHTVVLNESSYDGPVDGAPIKVSEQANVRIHDVTFGEGANLHVSDSTGVTLEDNHFAASADLLMNEDLTIRENDFETAGAEFSHVDGLQASNNRIDDGRFHFVGDVANVTMTDNYGAGQILLESAAGEIVIENNTLDASRTHESDAENAIQVDASEGASVVVARNDLSNSETGINVSANGPTHIHNNTVTNTTDYGLYLSGSSEDVSVTNNTITGSDVGVFVAGGYESGMPVSLEWNVVTDNRIGVVTDSNLPEVHWNDLSANDELGVRYTQESGIVNATHNYWGDRPASTEDEHAPFEDPVTGTLANGTGSAVSEGAASAGAERGVSDIRFDPWLDTTPDASDGDQSSDGDDSTDDPATTTTTSTTASDETTTTKTSEDTTTASTTTSASPDTTTATSGEKAATTTTTSGEKAATSGDETTTTSRGETTTTANEETTGSTTATAYDETTTTTATDDGTTLITGTTSSDVPGFGHLTVILALIGSALLAARHT